MADGTFNFVKGAVVGYAVGGSPETGETNVYMVLLFKKIEMDGALNNHFTLEDVLNATEVFGGVPSNVEANFDNYERKIALVPTVTVDDTNDRTDVDLPDQLWISAGGLLDTQNNDLKKVLVLWNILGSSSTPTNAMMCVAHYDLITTTRGDDLAISFNASGFFRVI